MRDWDRAIDLEIYSDMKSTEYPSLCSFRLSAFQINIWFCPDFACETKNPSGTAVIEWELRTAQAQFDIHVEQKSKFSQNYIYPQDKKKEQKNFSAKMGPQNNLITQMKKER